MCGVVECLGGLMMNSIEEEQPREGCSGVVFYLGGFDRLWMRSDLLWWLSLFIEALVLFPNIEREGSQQWPF